MNIQKPHLLAQVALAALWIYSPAWTRGTPVIDLPTLLTLLAGFALGVLCVDADTVRFRPRHKPDLLWFWTVAGALFGLLLGMAVGGLQSVFHGDWVTVAFLADCGFGMALGALIVHSPRVLRRRRPDRQVAVPPVG